MGLKPCPFCGGKVDFIITDREGNERDEEYEQDPWSGLGYVLSHEYNDHNDCPIATHEGEILGTRIYDDREEAAAAWNKRT